MTTINITEQSIFGNAVSQHSFMEFSKSSAEDLAVSLY